MNKCFFIGNLTRDPEHNTTGSGVSFCRFTIAVSRNFSNANGERETDFINIVCWRNLADLCAKYLSKGNKVCVSGALQIRSYDDKDGNRRQAAEIIADEVEFLTPKTSGEGSPSVASSPKKSVAALEPIDDGELPF